MSDFRKKLLNVIHENAVATFMNDDYELNIGPSESDVVISLKASASLHNMTCHGYSEGVITFSTCNKTSVEIFCAYLDATDEVQMYDISAAITDPFTKETDTTNELDFDTTRESEFIEYFIDVVLDSSLVNYNPVYFGTEDDTEDEYEDFEYQLDDTDDGSDYVSSDEVPMLIKLSSTLSASIYGKFLITVHPKDSSRILIQCNYSEVPELTDVEYDLETINSGDFGDSFLDEFELVTPAYYEQDSKSTTSASYKSINSDDVISIVEKTLDIEYIYSDMLTEITKVIKVNNRGKKRIKMQCNPGFKYSPERRTCVKISGTEVAHSRVSHRKMARTKKSLGNGYKTRIRIKVRRAKRFRKMMGM